MELTAIKTLKTLEFLCRTEGEVGVSQLARELGLNKSNAHRVLSTLIGLGYARRTEKSGYAASLKICELGALVGSRQNISRIAQRYLIDLSNRTGETVLIATLDGVDSLYLEKQENSLPGHIGASVGQRIPAYCCATGKVLLAYAPNLDRLIGGIKFERHTSYSISSRRRLLHVLDGVRSQGYAFNEEEFILGVSGVAVPIWNSRGDVYAALAITTPASRLSLKKVNRVVPIMQETAKFISYDLGYRKNVAGMSK